MAEQPHRLRVFLKILHKEEGDHRLPLRRKGGLEGGEERPGIPDLEMT